MTATVWSGPGGLHQSLDGCTEAYSRSAHGFGTVNMLVLIADRLDHVRSPILGINDRSTVALVLSQVVYSIYRQSDRFTHDFGRLDRLYLVTRMQGTDPAHGQVVRQQADKAFSTVRQNPLVRQQLEIDCGFRVFDED